MMQNIRLFNVCEAGHGSNKSEISSYPRKSIGSSELKVTVINPFKHLNLAYFYGTSANSEESDQNVASDQVLHCLLIECTLKIQIKLKPLKF